MREVAVAVDGPAGSLGATLALPEGVGPFPAVVLVSGSGPLDRDSNYKRMRFGVSQQLASALAEAGLASLRYDKRGVGDTMLDWRAAGLQDNADDLAAAVRTLRERTEVRDDAVLVVGHSEGAVLTCMVAAAGAPIVGIGLLAAQARTGRDVLRWQAGVIAPTLPRPLRALFKVLGVDPVAKVSKNHDKIERTTGDIARIGGARLNAKWFREFLRHDPCVDLEQVRVPVLAVTGTKDLQTPPEDLTRIGEAAGGHAELHVLPDITHTLRRQPGPPALTKYKRELRQPVDSAVIDLVVDWATRTTNGEHRGSAAFGKDTSGARCC